MEINRLKRFWIGVITAVFLITVIALAGCGNVPVSFSTPVPVPTFLMSTPSISTPYLIDQAFERGEITGEQRILYLVYTLYDYDSLPAQYHSNIPWEEDTFWATEIHLSITSGEVCKFSPYTQSEFIRILGSDAVCTQ